MSNQESEKNSQKFMHSESSHEESKTGTLFPVASPIGNLGDISARAAQTLASVDFVAAEDTRVTGKLLMHLGIKKPLVSYYEHNSRESGEKIIKRLLSGEDCALVTDAGTPGISDPGEDLIRQCIDSEIPIAVVPGPCAAVMALILSGLSSSRFTFEGFLSTSRKSRFEHLNELKTGKRTMIFYEAPHKLLRTLEDMLEAFGDRRVSLSRELTKLFEETKRCTLSEAAEYYKTNPPRGEFVVVIEGAANPEAPAANLEDAVTAMRAYTDAGLSLKDASAKVSEETGIPKNKLYKAAVSSK